MEKEVLIEIKNLTVNVFHKDYTGKKNIQNVYKNFNYKIYKKDRIIFIDNNGSGKSLLFDLIFCGLNNYVQTKGDGIEVDGEIMYNGKNILIPDESKRRPFCYITQDDPIRTNSTVLSMIELDCIANNIDIKNENVVHKIDNYLQRFGLSNKKHIRIGNSLIDLFSKKNSNNTLSFGEKKAVNLISKIITCRDKELILIDEPLNYLSFENSIAFNQSINELLEENKDITIFVISHCRGIDFVNKEVRFNSDKSKLIEQKYIKYDCFDMNSNCLMCYKK